VETWDAIVVGLGAHGSAAAASLARRGLRVLGLERFGRGEALGSSVGRSRIIRVAHYEDPVYAPLARAAWDAWRALEHEAATTLLTRTGALYAGPADSPVVAGALLAAEAHAVGVEVIDSAEIRRRWPAFAPDDDTVGVIEAEAGMLDADRSIAAHLEVSERQGARLRFGWQLGAWRATSGGGFEVESVDGEVLGADRLVLAAGPWMSGLVPDLRLPLVVERQPVMWFAPSMPVEGVSVDRFPVWLWSDDAGATHYGFPFDPELGLKVARHHTGERTDAESVERTIRPSDLDGVRDFIRARMPGASKEVTASTVCLYTNTPDDRFIIDRHPAWPGFAFASACSGHGFKFAPVIGGILADLAIDGTTGWDISPFQAARFTATQGEVPRAGATDGGGVGF
jgi:sarcosine oxidase